MRVGALIAALVSAPGLALGSTGAEPQRFVVAVGVDAAAPGLPPLRFASDDADRFADVMTELGGVPRDHVIRLRSPTRAQVESALGALSVESAKAHAAGSPDVAVFFYWSGHGDDTGVKVPGGTIPFATLRGAVQATGADLRVLVLDTCLAGSAARRKGSRAASFLAPRWIGDVRGEVLIASSAPDEASSESDEIGGSWFTHHLVSGLRGPADAGGDGRVSVDEAYRYAFARTVADTASSRGGEQHPVWDLDTVGSGEIVLTEPGRGAALSFSGGGRFLVFDEAARTFVGEASGDGARLAVAPGRYRVQSRGAELRETTVRVGAGETASIGDAQLRTIPWRDDVTKGAVAHRARLGGLREFSLTGRAGGIAFFDREVRKLLIPELPVFGIEASVGGVPGPPGGIAIELLVGGRDHTLGLPSGPVPSRYFVLEGGVGPYLAPPLPGAPALRPRFITRVALLWVHRSFTGEALQPAQDSVMVVPQLGFGLLFAPRTGFRAGVEGRLGGLVYKDTEVFRLLAHGEALISVGASF